MKILIPIVAVVALGCANYQGPTPAQCDALVNLAADAWVTIYAEASDDAEKTDAVARYADLAARAGELGCEFVPEPVP